VVGRENKVGRVAGRVVGPENKGKQGWMNGKGWERNVY